METLNAHEARVLGVLIEKETTTPDQYPLSINALVNGCNQKSNRDPQTDFLEAEVVVALQGLIVKQLAGKVSPAGSRVEKYRHNAGGALELEPGGLAVLAELLMRGPQAPGELRTRAHRMSPMPQQSDLMRHVQELTNAGYARRLPPAPGSRAERYVQLLAPDLHPVDAPPPAAPVAASAASAAAPAAPSPAADGDLRGRVESLEAEVARIRAALEELGAFES